MDKNIIVGFTDQASDEDLFGISVYIDGLAQFVEKCQTPITISIQGSWGTGKTSVMRIVKRKLDSNEKIKCFWFNTWQFSQFQMENTLSISFLELFCSELSLSDNKKEEVSNITKNIRNAGNVAKEVMLSLIDAKMGGRIAGNIESVMNTAIGENSRNSLDTIKVLRERFEGIIGDALKNEEKDRIVVFIDDLDRLEPRKAIELLEVLKIFFDCSQCVFILAIDYDVVIHGIKSKYGFSDNEKGKYFFDKIIQLPFKLPVASYNIRNYVCQCLNSCGLVIKDEEIGLYEGLIKNSVGSNPRTMKRLFNAFLLMKFIISEEMWNRNDDRVLLFAILCIQYADEQLYETFMECILELTNDDIKYFSSTENNSVLGASVDAETVEQWTPFFIILNDILGKIKNNDGDGINILKDVARFSSITAQTKKRIKDTKILSEDRNDEKKLNHTDMQYKILTLGSSFHIGFNEPVAVCFNGKEYNGKMHSRIKGRIDRLKDMYEENPDLKERDVLTVHYNYDDNKFYLEKL